MQQIFYKRSSKESNIKNDAHMKDCSSEFLSSTKKRKSRDSTFSRVESEKYHGSDSDKSDKSDIEKHEVFYS